MTAQTEFVVYLPDGSIVRSGSCPLAMVASQAHREGEAVLLGSAQHDLHYIIDGDIYPFTEGERKAKRSMKPGFIWKMPERIAVDSRTPQDHIAATRARRDALLLACDWTQLPDVPLATKQAWAAYRQALRDITNQPDPLAIEWLAPP